MLLKCLLWNTLVLQTIQMQARIVIAVNDTDTLGDTDIWLALKPDYETLKRLSKNVTRCTTTELSVQKETFLHNWEINGILQYLEHSRKFNHPFEVSTGDLTFKSDHVGGKWSFRITRSSSTTTAASGLKITASYAYESRYVNKISFAILLSIIFEDEDMVLPIQTSTDLPIVVQQAQTSRGSKSSKSTTSSLMEYRYDFSWPNLDELKNAAKISRADAGGEDGISDPNPVLFRFLVTAFYPGPIVTSRTDACKERVVRDFVAKKASSQPPFFKYSSSMLNDDRYFDLVITAENEDFLAHRIILASSSPVFSTLLFNESLIQPKNETSRLQMDDDISATAVEEMLLYVYTGQVENLSKSAANTILLAHRFILPELKEICEEWLISKLKIENALQSYQLGLEVNASQLAAKSFDVIRANKIKLFPTAIELQAFNEKHPNLVFDLFQSP